MSQLQTDFGHTRERARTIRFESETDLPETNVQEAIENLNDRIPPNVPGQRTVTDAGAVTILSTDAVVLLNKGDAAPINLPASATWLAEMGANGVPLFIKDISGNASSFNQTITPNGAETIDGLSTVVIATDFQGFNLFPKAAGGWTIK